MAKKTNIWFIVSMILIGVLVVGGIFGLISFGNNNNQDFKSVKGFELTYQQPQGTTINTNDLREQCQDWHDNFDAWNDVMRTCSVDSQNRGRDDGINPILWTFQCRCVEN